MVVSWLFVLAVFVGLDLASPGFGGLAGVGLGVAVVMVTASELERRGRRVAALALVLIVLAGLAIGFSRRW